MSHDLQMARDSDDGSYNLAIGEPYVLRSNFLDWIDNETIKKPLIYPHIGGEPELIQEIKYIESMKYVVITNGAKQAIEAAFYALAKQGKTSVNHQAPYWPSYPTLASNRGLEFDNGKVYRDEEVITVTSSPNNPDGRLDSGTFDIWDAVYAHPVYGFEDNKQIKAKIKIGSAAKMLGLSGCRVGWALTNDESIAKSMAHFIEITTSGVSILSQMHVASVLSWMGRFKDSATRLMKDARWEIRENGVEFKNYLGRMIEEYRGVPDSGVGMFAWFKVKQEKRFLEALDRSKVRLVTGQACGMEQPGWYRMSCGHRIDYTRAALSQLNKEYYG